jgi:hypothetical protein
MIEYLDNLIQDNNIAIVFGVVYGVVLSNILDRGSSYIDFPYILPTKPSKRDIQHSIWFIPKRRFYHRIFKKY